MYIMQKLLYIYSSANRKSHFNFTGLVTNKIIIINTLAYMYTETRGHANLSDEF